MAKTRYVVGFAIVESCYGGPEEGGWYYEAGRPVGKFWTFFKPESAYAFRDHLQDLIEKQDRFPGVGVGGCGDDEGLIPGEALGRGVKACVQHSLPKSKAGLEPWPLERPYYC